MSLTPQDTAELILKGDAICQANTFILNHHLVGSAAYMHEPNDVDYIVLTRGPWVDLAQYFVEKGWQECGEYDAGEEQRWGAIRLGDLNFMLTDDGQFMDDYVKATELCKALNLQTKKERIIVCRIVRDGCNAAEALAAAAAEG